MKINGSDLANKGITINDLLLFKTKLEEAKITCEFLDLNEDDIDGTPAVLIIRNGVNHFIEDRDLSLFWTELTTFEWDIETQEEVRF